MFKGFEPVYTLNSEVLILGSFPSVKSRQYGFYYGNKQNRFWKMLEGVFNENISDDIESKKEFLIKHNIALFDIVSESDLKGSADYSLVKSSHRTSDISMLLPPCTSVKKILCNGKMAYDILMKNYTLKIPVICMPSTSPANVSYNYSLWEKELEFLVK